MFEKLKKLTLLAALAASLGAASLSAPTTANAMPRGPVAETEAPANVHFRPWHRRHRHWGPPRRSHRHWNWRRCRKFLKLYHLTGDYRFLNRYRRCVVLSRRW